MKHLFYCTFLCLTVFVACTPKTTQETQSTSTQNPVKPTVSDNPCATFSDSKAGEAALDAHVIYRDFMRQGQIGQAIPYWRQAFKAAPAADGLRTTHFDDGVRIYDYLLKNAAAPSAKQRYLDSLLRMYDRMQDCYPENQYVDGKKAFDLYYNYKDLTNNQTIFEYFTNVIDKEKLETPAFVINPFTALLSEMYFNKEIDQETAQKYALQLLDITRKHADLIENAPCDMSIKYEKNAQGNCVSISDSGNRTPADGQCCAVAEDIQEGWPIVLGYAPQRLEEFEAVKGFYPCSYYKEKYMADVDLKVLSCDDIKILGSQLRQGQCGEDDALYASMVKEYNSRCATPAGPSECWKLLEAGKYQEAADCFDEYIAGLDEADKRARYNLYVAKIYYAHIRNFSKARQYARAALRDDSSMGEAYLLIGKLYASSGPLCGPGRGWDSQIVTWPAIDMFNKAKSIDASVAGEANRLIREYSKYMPSVEDIFQRQLQEGQSFQVGCWIQETTTIRAAR